MPVSARCATMLCLVLATTVSQVTAQNELEFSAGTLIGQSVGSVAIEMTNDAEVESFTIAVGFDASSIDVVSIGIAGTITETIGAELVFPEIFATGGFILGVFLDVDPPFDGQVIPIGSDTAVATFEIMPTNPVVVPETVTFEFVDGTFGSPSIDNTLVQSGGTIIDASSGLVLTSGDATLLPADLHFYFAGAGEIEEFGADTLTVLFDNNQGLATSYQLTLTHPEALALESISIDSTDAGAVGAESVVTEILATSGSLAVVFDTNPPFDGQALGAGLGLSIGQFEYSCLTAPTLPSPPAVHLVDFAGTPTATVGGLEVPVTTESTTVTCLALTPANTSYAMGDVSGQNPTGAPGQPVTLYLFVQDEDDPIQGVQMAISYHCDLNVTALVDITGTALETIGAEFVDSNFDNDPTDGDGCELVVGILLDALPPFDGQTIPASSDLVAIGTVAMQISDSAVPGVALDVEFPETVDGTGAVDIENIVVIDFNSIEVINRTGTAVQVVDATSFVRGDADTNGVIDLADCLALLSHVFSGVTPSCVAASDSDADLDLDLDDFFALASYLFLSAPPLPAPSTGCGVDLDADCGLYSSCD